MTIGTSTSRVSFACDGATKIFPVPIQAYLAADFTVILTAPLSAGGGQATLTLNSDYSLVTSGTLSPTAWTLATLPATAYLTGYTLQVFCNPVQTQQTQYVQGQAFPSLAVQTNIDRLTQMVQRLEDQIGRAILAPDGDVSPVMQLPIATVRALKSLMMDANGNLALGVPNTQTITTALLAPFLGLGITAAETAALVTPTTLAYPPGDVRRYGADPTGVADSATAISNAIKSNNYVRIPAGQYLVNSQINVNRSWVTIEGDNQAMTIGFGHTFQSGTWLNFGSAVSGASMFFWGNAAYQSINIRRLGINLNNATLAQIGLRFGQVIGARLSDLWIIGEGIGTDDTTAIQLDGLLPGGGFSYTGDFDIERCYLANHLKCVNILGVCTTVRVLHNEMNGTSAGGVAGSFGVSIPSTCAGVQVIGNTITQYRDGVLNSGVGTRIAHNYYEKNTNNCTNTHVTNLAAALLGSTYIDGPAPVYPAGTADQMMVFERNICYVGTFIESATGFREKGRNFNAGEYLTRTFAAGNYTSNAGTWVVASATTDESTIVGKMMTFAFYVAGTATGAGSELRIAIPQQTVNGSPVAVNAAKRTRLPIHIFQNATYAFGLAEVQVGDAFIRCYKDATLSGSWTNGDCEVFGQITFEIQ